MTKQVPYLDQEDRVFTFSDVVRFFHDHRKKWIRIAWAAGICAFFFFSLQETPYYIQATFKEGTEKNGAENTLKELLTGIGGQSSHQPQAVVLMKSYQVFKPLCQKLGLQASIANSNWIFAKAFERIADNWRIERGAELEDSDPFVFENVIYEGEKPLLFWVRFLDRDHFEIFSKDRKTRLAESCLGKEASLPLVSFTLSKTPKKLKCKTFYKLHINPWIFAANGLRSHLKITNDKLNRSIYNLSLRDRDRHFGTRILNELMFEYQRFLKKDHDELAKNQLAYLEQRQEELYKKISRTFDEHVAYLSGNVEMSGFIGVEQANEILLEPYQELLNRVCAIDLELSHLDQMEAEGKPVSLNSRISFSGEFKEISRKLQDLKQKRDLIEISLQRRNPLQDKKENSIDARRDELHEIRAEKGAIENLIKELDENQEISSFGLNQTLYHWARGLQESPKSEEWKDLCEYLDNHSRLLSLREKILQERFFYSEKTPIELEGIDLNTASQLFVEYNNRLDKVEASRRYYNKFREEVMRNDVELGSLSSLLNDPLSQGLISSANKIALQLKDEKYYSSKEGQRWEEELLLYRKILSDHLGQLAQVEELNMGLIRDKIVGLQQASLDCINQQISVLYESLEDAIKEQRSSLLEEKKAVSRKMEEIRSLAKGLPEKWRLEKWLELKTEMGQNIMETLTQLVESKTIGRHLFHVESKPLDNAIAPILPKKPHLILKTFAAAFLASLGIFFMYLIRAIFKGFPASLDNLQALRFPVLGPISVFCDGPDIDPLTGRDLESIRKISLFLEKKPGKVIGLIGGRGPDYSYSLAENLARVSYKSIVLRCDFHAKFKDDDQPGLLQFWKGEIVDLPIRNGKGFDFMTAGGFTPFGSEAIQSRIFKKLIERLQTEYDWVFILIRSPLDCSESLGALRLCDKAIVTVCKERIEQLTPFAAWAYDEDQCRLMFMVCD